MHRECMRLCRDVKYKNITKEEFIKKIDEITEDADSSINIFYKIYYVFCDSKRYQVPKEEEQYFLDNIDIVLTSPYVENKYKNIFKSALIKSYFSLGDYNKAEKYANELLNSKTDDYIIIKQLLSYYIQTRRYDIAKDIIDTIDSLSENYAKEEKQIYEDITSGKRSEYMPYGDKKINYIEFMQLLNIEIKETKKENNNKKKYYHKEGFKTFVAFDLETTGLNTNEDEIIEIGAIKVIDGQIVEEKDFIFQELIKPNRIIPQVVEDITHITNDMVQNSRTLEEVIVDFKNFIGNNILLGYNCNSFDKRFLDRLTDIDNSYFDVIYLSRKYRSRLNCKNIKLNEVASSLNITNLQAHRALADAITTAKVYLKMIEMDN